MVPCYPLDLLCAESDIDLHCAENEVLAPEAKVSLKL